MKCRFLLLFPLMIVLFAAPSQATVPEPTTSDVPDCITMTLDGSYVYEVVVRDAFGTPCVGALVQITFSTDAFGMVAWCLPAPPSPTFSAITSIDGVAQFVFEGGGCVLDTQLAACGGPVAAEVIADAILLEEVLCINSPDVVSPTGSPPSCPPPTSICSAGFTSVGLSDAVYHTLPIALANVDRCSNFTGPDYNDPVGLSDAVFLTPYIIAGAGCACL